MSIVVFGSINLDLVARVPRLPLPGETLIGSEFEQIPGGKGANQAVAAARLGVATELVGRVGNDAFGQRLRSGLQIEQVGCDRVLVDPATHSGVAMISVNTVSNIVGSTSPNNLDNTEHNPVGENSIIVIPGANGRIDGTDLARLQPLLRPGAILLLQLEIPVPIVLAAAQAAKQAGAMVILDPAPAQAELPAALYTCVDVITPNQVEASQLTGVSVQDPNTATQAAQILHNQGVPNVIVKLGAMGALWLTAEQTMLLPSFPVAAIDTVAAGDAFNGGLAAGFARGLAWPEAVRQAMAVAALSVTRSGAQPSLPTQTEVQAFLARYDAENSAGD